MRIYLVRHGVAEERGGKKPDEDRALTKEGKRKTRKAMRGFARLRESPRRILSSPLVRAWETAELLAEALEVDLPRVEKELAPGGDPRAVLDRLQREDLDAVAVVGHEPDLSRLAKVLTGGAVELRKGAIARVDGEPASGRGTLAWLLQPFLLRRLGR